MGHKGPVLRPRWVGSGGARTPSLFYSILIPNMCHKPSPSLFSWFDDPNNIWWGTQITKLTIMQSLWAPYYVVPLRPKYLPQRPILKGLRLGFSFNAWGLVSPHNKTTDKITRMYISMLIVLNIKLEDKTFWTEWYQVLPQFNLLLISSWMQFWFLKNYSQRFEFCHNFKEFLSWFCPEFCSRCIKRVSSYSFISGSLKDVGISGYIAPGCGKISNKICILVSTCIGDLNYYH
jgi:hypothetical protein